MNAILVRIAAGAALGAWLVFAPAGEGPLVIGWPAEPAGAAFAAEPVKTPSCMPRAVLAQILVHDYGEYRFATGDRTDGVGERIEIYVAAGGRTWSLIVVDRATGFACLSTAGRNWRLAPQGDPT